MLKQMSGYVTNFIIITTCLKKSDTVIDLGTGYGEEALYLHDKAPNSLLV